MSLRHRVKLFVSNLREKRKDHQRSPEWKRVREKFIKDNPKCAACGETNHLQVHHIMPFHLHPELELDPNNLVVLCMDINECHLLIGHGDSWKSYNPNVKKDVIRFNSSDKPHRQFIIEDIRSKRIYGINHS